MEDEVCHIERILVEARRLSQNDLCILVCSYKTLVEIIIIIIIFGVP
jgi:hypothetical protein